MRDPSRIPKVLEALRRVWEASPDLRLTQLLLNVTSFHCPEMFVMEDDVLMRRIAEFEDAARRPRESKLPPDLAPVHLPPAAFEIIDDLPFHVDAARRILLARWKMSSTHRLTLWMAPDGSPIKGLPEKDLVKVHCNIPTKNNNHLQGMGFALGLLLRAGYKPGMTAEETRAALAARERPAADRHTSTSTPVCPHCGHVWPEVRKPPPTDGPGRARIVDLLDGADYDVRQQLRENIASNGRAQMDCPACEQDLIITCNEEGRFTTKRPGENP